MKSELEILDFWDREDIFKKSIERRDTNNNYSFYDGPPFATGLPHYGHILASTIKDIIPRFWAMRGKRIERKWGWDCHGLPIENIIEQKLNLKTRKDILDMGVKEFNAACRSSVLEYAAEWKKTIRRLGRWVDMEHDYKTMDPEYMESLWWVFRSLWDKKLIYEGRKSMHICPRCETALSNFEVTQGYKEITDLSAYVKFELVESPKTYVLAWTTTPWTLPGNAALAVHPDTQYSVVHAGGTEARYIIATKLLPRLFEKKYLTAEVAKVGATVLGKDLVGKSYVPLFPDYIDSLTLNNKERGWKIYAADFVNIEDGTGIVHIAPAFGEDDQRLGEQEHLPFIQHVSTDGTFKPEVLDFALMHVKPKDDHQSGDVEIIKYLAHHDTLFAKEKYTHSYPHCWRCETPLLNYSTTSWFVKVTELKEQLIKHNKEITWVPEHMKEGRFGKWLEGARDWAISRSRFWGTPLPIWRAEDGDILCIGSREELERLSGVQVSDLHKDVVDDIVIKKDGKEYRRIPEVLDCWFESGSMPYAQFHYPFENKELFEKSFPAEFIGEGQDQTRGWFYTLHVLATALYDKPAFHTVIVNGIILAGDGKKMSKRLKNYPEPDIVINKYGADALRMYLALSPAMEAETLNFSEAGVDEVYKKINLLAGNILKFWELYAPTLNDSAPMNAPESKHVLDQWIVAKTHQLIRDVTAGLEQYRITAGARPIVEYLQDLSTWYVRRSRDRFKEEGEDKTCATQTLGWALRQLSTMLSPFMPMLAEGIYQSLPNNEKESVHLLDWPDATNYEVRITKYSSVLEQMEIAKQVASLAHTLRAQAGIKVRQPLARIVTNKQLAREFQQIVAEETNVQEIVIDNEQWNALPSIEERGTVVRLDTNINEELEMMGFQRELIRTINNLRKELGMTLSDRATIVIEANEQTFELVQGWKSAVLVATLCTDIVLGSAIEPNKKITIKESPVIISLTR